MLSREEARTRLEGMRRSSNARGGLIGRVAGRSLAVTLGLEGRTGFDLPEAGKQLDAVSGRVRRAMLEGVVPGIGAEAEWMWEAGIGLPYQFSHHRRAYRAPNDPEYSRHARAARLMSVARTVRQYRHDGPVWLARWAPYLHVNAGPLLSAVIDRGGRVGSEVFDVLIASADGEDEIGMMGRHVIAGLLGSSRSDGWEYVEQLLLAAQRQEGLRQVILESADEGRPEAFLKILRLILEHDLVRFSAAARAVSVWFGMPEMAGDLKRLRKLIEGALGYVEEPDRACDAVRSGDAEDAFLGLTALAWGDAVVACRHAMDALAAEEMVERRFALVLFLSQARIAPAAAPLSAALEDSDLRVAVQAMRGLRGHSWASGGTTERLEALIARLGGKSVELPAIVWPWTASTVAPTEPIGELLRWVGDAGVDRALPHLGAMDAQQRARVARSLEKSGASTAVRRRAVLTLAGDAAGQVREQAIKTAATIVPSEEETIELEQLLSRKAGDLRRGIIALLRSRGSARALESADRLLADRNAERRAAGVELLRQLAEAGDAAARQRIAAEKAKPPAGADSGSAAVAALERTDGSGPASLDDALGLLPDRGDVTRATPMRKRPVEIVTTTAAAAAISLDQLVERHKQDEVECEIWDGRPRRDLFGNLEQVIGPRALGRMSLLDVSAESDEQACVALRGQAERRLPLLDVWLSWSRERGERYRDPDGLELARMLFVPMLSSGPYPRAIGLSNHVREAVTRMRPIEAAHGSAVNAIAWWLVLLEPPDGVATFLLDAAEHVLAFAPSSDFRIRERDNKSLVPNWRQGWADPLDAARTHRHLCPTAWTAAEERRLWELEVWVERPTGTGLPEREIGMRAPEPAELVSAFLAGAATEADVIARLLGPASLPPQTGWGRSQGFPALRDLSGRTLPDRYGKSPALAAIVKRCTARVVEVELQRGEAPTVTTGAAKTIRYAGGMDILFAVLRALGKEPFLRGWSWADSDSRKSAFSHLVRVTFPGEQDTAAAFAERAKAAKLSAKRLLELAAYAPQWSRHVEAALDVPGLVEAVWWFHAHTKDSKWSVEQEIRDAWAAEVGERTPLTSAELIDGACDVDWFQRAHAAIGPNWWAKTDAAAKYCSSAGGHTRAQLFARAMQGLVTEAELIDRINEKRHQDTVRALGLLPVSDSGPGREAQLLDRYTTLQDFIRTSRQFGSQRQASERRAAEIGLSNLARTAGYRDPLRLEWAMEATKIADLVDQPAVASIDDLTVSLSIDLDGAPALTVTRGEKRLQSVPAAHGKDPAIAELRMRVTDLRRQRSRIRGSLEQTMIRSDAFTGTELRQLCRHPLLYPQLAQLILIGDGTAGYPQPDGRALRDHAGTLHAIGPDEPLHLAHPVDLLERGDWPDWQRDCIDRKITQPFKQVFRELYLLTAAEREEKDHSTRYAGHQIQPRAALALLGGRGWVAHPDEGVRRPFHYAGIAASLWFLNGVLSPVEVEAPTLEQVRFSKIGEWDPVPLADVPPRIFSEVMRDLDLVVSVAHVGGVDPEASASTIEMRAALLAETQRLLKVDNVTIQTPRALIKGSIGDYSVHLGSAIVHRQPGGAVCIVPVHSQHRGRLFLPFADDDPKTAEVISKVLLLANDHEIKDPTILEQLT